MSLPSYGEFHYLLVAMCLVACAVVLISEWRNWRAGKWIFKTLASSAFVLLAYSLEALESVYGSWVLLGLGLSWLGDVLLIPSQSKRSFILGIMSFLLGHIAYSLGFWSLGFDVPALVISFVIAALLGWLIYRWLSVSLEGAFRAVVPVYIAVIMLMVVAAVSASVHVMAWGLVTGAVLFAVSDIFVARERFVISGVVNRLVGLPLYYIAQLILASSVVIAQ